MGWLRRVFKIAWAIFAGGSALLGATSIPEQAQRVLPFAEWVFSSGLRRAGLVVVGILAMSGWAYCYFPIRWTLNGRRIRLLCDQLDSMEQDWGAHSDVDAVLGAARVLLNLRTLGAFRKHPSVETVIDNAIEGKTLVQMVGDGPLVKNGQYQAFWAATVAVYGLTGMQPPELPLRQMMIVRARYLAAFVRDNEGWGKPTRRHT